MKNQKQLKSELEKMYAIELLEYHDKNHLSGDNCKRSETRQEMLLYSIKLLSENEGAIKERILDAPVKHNLIEIFKELKFGRPSESQKFLQKCIDELSGTSKRIHDKLEMQLAFEAGSKRKDFEKWYKEAEKKWF
jgi:hypothetical protein